MAPAGSNGAVESPLERIRSLVAGWRDRGRRNVLAVAPFLGAIDAKALVACGDHLWVGHPVLREPHH
jgi:hypothetical protein